MNKKITFLLFILCFFILVCYFIPSLKKNIEISDYENNIQKSVKNALVQLEKYENTGEFQCIVNIAVELERCENYLCEISKRNNFQTSYWDLITAANQLRSFETGDEIKGLEDLKNALKYMQRSVYSVGEGYFKSFTKKNMGIK